jgi:hypothetical protein
VRLHRLRRGGPKANLIMDSKANLHDTTATGFAGVAFELTP